MDIGKSKTLIMGILNVTPDSFSDGGKYTDIEHALSHARRMVEEGVDIIDVGGESTRPGHHKVSTEEEIDRVIPVIEALAREVEVPISIDTYKAEVARLAIEAGAQIINDVWGAKADPLMAGMAGEYSVPIILMHNRHNMDYNDLIRDMLEDLQESIRLVKEAGVKDEQIIIDPGIGFAKTWENNLEVLARLEQFTGLGYPVLLGTSRKSFIGHVLDLPVDDRLEGTLATTALGIMKGCRIIRVHDVKENVRVARLMDEIVCRGQEGRQHG